MPPPETDSVDRADPSPDLLLLGFLEVDVSTDAIIYAPSLFKAKAAFATQAALYEN